MKRFTRSNSTKKNKVMRKLIKCILINDNYNQSVDIFFLDTFNTFNFNNRIIKSHSIRDIKLYFSESFVIQYYNKCICLNINNYPNYDASKHKVLHLQIYNIMCSFFFKKNTVFAMFIQL